jgi:hypothetical protein
MADEHETAASQELETLLRDAQAADNIGQVKAVVVNLVKLIQMLSGH